MKRIIRGLSAVLAIVMMLSMPVYAAEEAVPYSSAYIASYNASLEQITDNVFRIWFEVFAARHIKEEIGVNYIEVQMSTDGVNWNTMSVYTPLRTSNMIAENTMTHASYIAYPGVIGRYYRAYVVFYAKDSTGFGEIYEYTEVLYLQPLNS